jgi:2,4-dienoyl-CoA reductase-like NADH-dependent reductase (Old Yellow Enzyme family)
MHRSEMQVHRMDIMKNLFDPLNIGSLELRNRIVMAPLTRLRGTPDHIPTPLMVEYYRQRASAGLILSEGTPVDPMGVGYANVPGIWSQQQVEGWKPVTEAVHQAGGRIFAQIWHVGRISHSSFLGGKLPVAPSAIAAGGHISLLRPLTPFETPRALELSEIPGIVEAFGRGARNAQAAGFDGVELHGANGYLLDQFLQDSTNHRTDAYGGPIENRARLMLECADAAIAALGAGRVGMHLAPRCDSHSMGDSNPAATFGYVARELGKRKIAFLCLREAQGPDSLGPQMKREFGGVMIANEKFTLESAQRIIAAGDADAVAFGKQFIANPDLPRRFAAGAPLNEPVPATFYEHGATGYTDYPALPEG